MNESISYSTWGQPKLGGMERVEKVAKVTSTFTNEAMSPK
jgi:hypothetical protein